MKAKDLIKILKRFPNYDVRLMYAEYSGCSVEYPFPKYVEIRVYGVNTNLTTETFKTLYLAYEEI